MKRNYDRMYRNSYEEKKEDPIVEKEIVIKEETPKEIKKKSYIGIVIGGLNLNIRNQPNGKVVGSLKDGERVAILEDSDAEWYKIADGYIMKKFIKIEEV